ncbi:hypothetical protein BRC89_02910 [Halobacteriales archaeon QS_4_70_19]|jgi:hypothetical protein|nr:MAG: hypothetical protein BRC89_02910 [Halobacteriales archaeon QS_4_70_19]
MAPDPTDEPQGERTHVPVAGGELAVPAAASDEEAAALVAAVASHLRDQQATAGGDEEPDTVEPWQFAERVGAREHADLPTPIEQGDAWKMATRVRR